MRAGLSRLVCFGAGASPYGAAVSVTVKIEVTLTTIGVLSLQGDFIEHELMLLRLGVSTRQVRSAEDLRGLDGLIIPGGESTTFCRLMEDFNLYEAVGAFVKTGA